MDLMNVNEITLAAGGLRWSASSAGDGPVVLCLHGFPDHRGTFHAQLPALAAAGYHAVAPSLRGYEPSSQPPDRDYHIARLADDVIAWLDQLGAERAHVVGHDWGAIVAYTVAARAPERIAGIAALAVPHPLRTLTRGMARVPRQLRNSWYVLFFQLRGIADFVVAKDDFAFLEMLWRDWSPGWRWPPEQMDALKRAFRQPGVLKAALGYYRAFFDFFSPAGRETLAALRRPIPVPTLALTGATDGCLDTRVFDAAMDPADFPAGLAVHRVDGAGHFLHQERPGAVNRILLDWLRRPR